MRGARLLATDLDRTLIPNGEHRESPGARDLLTALVRAKGLLLAFVTGRSLRLVEEAMAEYELPEPQWLLADVGSTMYRREGGAWREMDEWSARLARDWPCARRAQIGRLVDDLPGLRRQEPDAQRPFKLSFYAERREDVPALCARLGAWLEERGMRSVVVPSIDETRNVTLVDALPASGTKRGALAFLIERRGLASSDVLFAGDSGNDREVLTSPIPSVLVANAGDELRARVLREAARLGTSEALYLARGGVLGMNGNYAAGILEGWLHFHPEDRASLPARN